MVPGDGLPPTPSRKAIALRSHRSRRSQHPWLSNNGRQIAFFPEKNAGLFSAVSIDAGRRGDFVILLATSPISSLNASQDLSRITSSVSESAIQIPHQTSESGAETAASEGVQQQIISVTSRPYSHRRSLARKLPVRSKAAPVEFQTPAPSKTFKGEMSVITPALVDSSSTTRYTVEVPTDMAVTHKRPFPMPFGGTIGAIISFVFFGGIAALITAILVKLKVWKQKRPRRPVTGSKVYKISPSAKVPEVKRVKLREVSQEEMEAARQRRAKWRKSSGDRAHRPTQIVMDAQPAAGGASFSHRPCLNGVTKASTATDLQSSVTTGDESPSGARLIYDLKVFETPSPVAEGLLAGAGMGDPIASPVPCPSSSASVEVHSLTNSRELVHASMFSPPHLQSSSYPIGDWPALD
eukprot:CAMPEP_0184643340 /NCGR_PEP_ID=MMETSP0308-20130426/170_1 /TAXON_ID=38269 /ORGANISM="Gloeochaete witrockiana, Strain SAG 46.84" /LENGTH=409 /DNA_ID=CAMNT_0027071211 /DNA_START=207 /DNA_END=1436 /DNA_ORIENTATION=-